MLLSNIWKIRRRLQSKQSKRRSPAFDQPVQVLEERAYLSASTLFFDGELSIVIEEGNDRVAVGTNPLDPTQVQVRVNDVVDQSLPNLRAARLLGMKTVWVSGLPRAPDYVMVKVASVRQLPRVLHRLGFAL